MPPRRSVASRCGFADKLEFNWKIITCRKFALLHNSTAPSRMRAAARYLYVHFLPQFNPFIDLRSNGSHHCMRAKEAVCDASLS